MVVGAGVSGIQAALDAATSGFKVYLVDKGPAIGGKMSQLDKTFPTNDCSMCILSPKFIECATDPNIDDPHRRRGRTGRRGSRRLSGHLDPASPDTWMQKNARGAEPAPSTALSMSLIPTTKTWRP